MSSNPTSSPSDKKPSGGRRSFILGATMLAALGGAFGVHALADSKTGQHMRLAASDGGWFSGMRHGGHWRGHHKGRLFDMSDAEIDAKVTRAVKHVGIEIDATAEQQEKIIALVKSAAKELRPLRDQMHATRSQAREMLLADNFDRAALETLRAERLADFDRISKTLVDTLADIAEVLTPAQRKLLEERIGEFRSHRRGWNRG